MRRLVILMLNAMIMCALSAFGQSGLKISAPEHDFGSIAEEGGIVRWTFEGVNEGEEPELILTVSTTCGCTTPHYSRKPILPGGRFTIEVHYDPAGRPGPFDKKLVVYNAERKGVAELRILGSVVARKRRVEESYPIAIAQGVRLTNNFLNFGVTPKGAPHTVRIGVVNTSQEERVLTFINKGSSGFLQTELPIRLAAGEATEIELHYEVPTESAYYGTARDRFELAVNGMATGIPFTVEALIVDDPATVIGDLGSARFWSETESVRMGEQPIERGSCRRNFLVENRGSVPLIIRAVECTKGVACSLQGGEQIAPGKRVQVEAILDTHAFDYGAAVGKITLICNDPEHPVQRIRVSAILIDE